MPEWRQALLDEEHKNQLSAICSSLTHLIIFSVEVDAHSNIVALDRFPSESRLSQLQQICKQTHEVKLILCFGGNSRSNGFSNVVSSQSNRQKFIDNLKQFIEEKSVRLMFDG
jgi:GH18 family chitinase